MLIFGKTGRVAINSSEDLVKHLRAERNGNGYGAFILTHDENGPSLWIHINNDMAYLHYFADAGHAHPGFQPLGMAPNRCPVSVDFVQVDGGEADGFSVPKDAVVSSDVAYSAAEEFFWQPQAPSCITWQEL